MKISETALVCGLSIHTIRFYEKSGMLPEIKRSADGHRRFSPSHVEWLTLLYWLRETGMPLRQMKRFTALAPAIVKNELVKTAPCGQHIVARAPASQVPAAIAHKNIITRAAEQQVIAFTTNQTIAPQAAQHQVFSVIAVARKLVTIANEKCKSRQIGAN